MFDYSFSKSLQFTGEKLLPAKVILEQFHLRHYPYNEDYAASYALVLINNSPDLIGEWGSVVVLPNKGLVDICRISKEKPLDFVKFIQRTKPLIEKSYKEHPQPISNEYFWYYKGKFTRINVMTEANGNINVISPFGLTELMTGKR